MQISLIGLPGCGKSTVGRHFARRLGVAFIDSDQLIEQRLGCSISLFVEREGKDAFRDIEEAVLEELTAGTAPAVLSTAGGAVLRPVNRRHLHACGKVICLHAAPKDVLRRLRHHTTRPLWQVADLQQRLRSL